ncbi:MAG: hypothetical protein IJS52_05265, partial [Bacilli bacterium]|nr:hypothetical protein [Bacilli bacterium]
TYRFDASFFGKRTKRRVFGQPGVDAIGVFQKAGIDYSMRSGKIMELKRGARCLAESEVLEFEKLMRD